MATWAEFEAAEPELAAFGRERLDQQVCFQATLRADGSPRVHPVELWIDGGMLLVRFRARSPKVREVEADPRTSLHSPMDNAEGEGGEFLANGRLQRIDDAHAVAQPFVRDAEYPLAFYAISVDEAVATTYEGPEGTPTYRRWHAR